MEYTIDELARAAETTVRSVRVYHERGLLPSPDVRGRIGYYGTGHLDRLQTISRLLSRGMKLNGIRELLDAWDRGDGLADILGVSEPADPEPEAPMLVDPTADLPDYLKRAMAASGDPLEGYRLTNPRCGDLAARLVDAGLPATEALVLIERFRADCTALADRYAGMLFHQLAGKAYEGSERTHKDAATFETNLAITRLMTTRAATEVIDQTLARRGGLPLH
ncbi:MerR family transcriptional regulator [Nocardia yamanashiensis]|uniref:MerR family transcriptional regulator n=1 Tax=Nocardia yamanashiensis TaxID=209247 RepID=UPI00082FB979|nr:MerR family transcriptional regulator [Nocardia yamanashiensis]